MDKENRKILAGTAAVAAIVFWIGFPLYMQHYQGYSAINVAFAVIVFYWITLQLYKRYS